VVDKLTPERRSANMSRIRSENMRPELIVRSTAHRMGFRFRLHRRDLPGRPDLVFPKLKKIIFSHGCFWHQHANCIDGKLPKSRTDYWVPKLSRNVDRDTANAAALRDSGWQILTVWECETRDLPELSRKIRAFLEKQ